MRSTVGPRRPSVVPEVCVKCEYLCPTLIGIDIDAKRNDWISLDLVECAIKDVNLGLVFLVDSATEDILHDAIFESSPDGVVWVIMIFELFKTRLIVFFLAGRFEPSSDMYTSLQKWPFRVWGGQAVPR